MIIFSGDYFLQAIVILTEIRSLGKMAAGEYALQVTYAGILNQ